MAVDVMKMDRQRPVDGHLLAAGQLSPGQLESIRRLATQLAGTRVLPVIGAGASWDCGVRVGGEIATDLYDAYHASSDFEPHDPELSTTDLPGIAQAMFVRRGQERVVDELGLPDPARWRPAATLGDHFCVYCVVARMVREGLLGPAGSAFSFNYDCGAEAGFRSEGFAYGDTVGGSQWLDRARVVSDAATDVDFTSNSATFTLYKVNGCAVRYRELAQADPVKAAEEIVIRRDQLDKWPDQSWSRERFRVGVRDHIIMLIGFAAQDSKFTGELNDVLQQIYSATSPVGFPRVVAIDRTEAAASIEGVIRTGLGGVNANEDVVTQIDTTGSSTTGAMLVLLTEMLSLALADRFEQVGVTLPVDPDARLATFTISTPSMLKWAYLADPPSENGLIQRANQIARGGYVPHTHDPYLSATLVSARKRLRRRFGRADQESSSEALANGGFIVEGPFAYMPVGLPIEVLERSCREGPELEALRRTLREQRPRNVECVLVAGDGTRLTGVNLENGQRIDDD
jgi:hypothetical protein